MRYQVKLQTVMGAVVACAILLALIRSVGWFVLIPIVMGLIEMFATWVSFRGKQRLAGLWFFRVCTLSDVAGLIAFVYFRRSLVLIGGLLILMAVPVSCGLGAAWLTAARHGGTRNRSPSRLAWLLVFACATFPLWMAVMHWPLRVAFVVSAPALERLADRVEADNMPRAPVWAGLFRIVDFAVDRKTGNVAALIVDDDATGRSGLVRLGSGVPLEARHGPLFNMAFEGHLSGRWWSQEED